MENISAESVINLVPDKLLDELAVKSKVDYSVKKLQGKIVFKLFLYAVFSGKNVSLRILETIYNSEKFKNLFNVPSNKIKHSGIGMRLSNIDYRYFENIFNYLINSKKINDIIFSNKKINVRKIDSTLVVLSSKLLAFGMYDNANKKSIKYSTELNQGIPVNIMLFKDQKDISEDNALPKLIEAKTLKSSLNIAIFDRGIQRKQSFVDFDESSIYFISRLTNHKYEVVENLPLKEKSTSSLELISDQIIRFKSEKETIDREFRLVVGRNKKTHKIISFITNVHFLEASEIAELYKSRWEIETFFKFIKQELNFSHLLSRNENGIKAVMFLTMIAAVLLTVYKRVNNIIGWAVAKIKFLDELEMDLMRNWHFEMSPIFYPKKDAFLARIRDG